VGLVIAAVGAATVAGVAGGGIAVLGVIEAATGRIVINLRQLPWPRRDAQLIGTCRVLQGTVIATYGAMAALILGSGTALDPKFETPAFLTLGPSADDRAWGPCRPGSAPTSPHRPATLLGPIWL
jgi:hypothetical protein